ncbi:copper chaperone PCu(A)C [Methylonatrum kenyense]|uniref:copper chaperone PCu(A)C n=1 Tax=Methylonatrum kenyense TaxID=455253 RepID=UPI0020BE5AC0|nr:copper chaperone PCu(A)C [Methylonatrum kenyense]MCK8517086.1 copper chaperone PCu(A)C [Methylonatrum kenyense]
MSVMLRTGGFCSALVLLAAAFAPLASADEITIHDPWVRWVPEVSDRTAAYMRIEAPEGDRKILIGVDSPQFDRAEIHESVEEDGQARMVHWSTLRIPAGGERVLEPGGYHIMLIGRQGDALEEGDVVELQMRFQSGEILTVEMPVSREGLNGDDEHDHHHHH